MTPKKINVKEKKTLYILWDNGAESTIPLKELRRNCPCANCVTERQKRKANYIPLYSTVQSTLKDIKVIGNYAIQLTWGDGHDEGIYSFELLASYTNVP